MTITFKFGDGAIAELEILEDYGAAQYYHLIDIIRAYPKLGKLKDIRYE